MALEITQEHLADGPDGNDTGLQFFGLPIGTMERLAALLERVDNVLSAYTTHDVTARCLCCDRNYCAADCEVASVDDELSALLGVLRGLVGDK